MECKRYRWACKEREIVDVYRKKNELLSQTEMKNKGMGKSHDVGKVVYLQKHKSIEKVWQFW